MSTSTSYTYEEGIVKKVTIYDAVTADVDLTSAEKIECVGAKAIALAITEGGTVNNRSAAFTVYVSIDGGVTFAQYNMLIDNVTNTNAQNLTRVASKTRNSAGTDILWFDPATLRVITHFKLVIDVTDGAAPTGNFTGKAAITT